MKKWMNKDSLVALLVSAILAFEILMLTDCVIVWCGGEMNHVIAAAYLATMTVCIWMLHRFWGKTITALTVLIPAGLAVAGLCGYLGWCSFSTRAAYASADAGKVQMYGGRKVMLIVPHQDDELNILGGVLEEYARYGSEIYAVYSTNGDYETPAQVRYQEALAVFRALDVPEDHVFFLGYGNEWKQGGPHIYNAEPDQLLESYAGGWETYGSSQHSAYQTGKAYTLRNLTDDLRSVILECRPDIIFCSDYDDHIDHKALSLLFDKVMGQIRKENPEYTPVVYKTYAYSTAWTSEPDYYASNVLSTKNPFGDPHYQKPEVYQWENRVRLPVEGGSLSRSLVKSEGIEMLKHHKSQYAAMMAASVINGDRVAWRRYTDSLCLDAQIAVTSGNGSLLNDFMLIENNNLVDADHKPYDGVWIPDGQDTEKRVDVTLPQAGPLAALVLYDHPSEEHNVLNAVVTFDDGTQLETGPLNPGGAATLIAVEKEKVSSFSVELTQIQGRNAGLSEMEAFSEYPEPDGRYIKLMDREENFLYDYRTAPDGTGELLVYFHGDLPDLTEENYHIGITGGHGTAVLDGDVIRVSCPEGEAFVLNITCDSAGVSDSIYVRNPGAAARRWMDFWQKAEEAVFLRYSRADQKKLQIISIPKKMAYVLRHLG